MMPLPDLLQWLASARKSGTLELERERVRKWILMREGEIVGCSSDDPPERLGQFLLGRGRITEAQLHQALVEQEQSGNFLGQVFIAMGAITEQELSSHLEAKAEESIFSLFDWTDAAFRFHENLDDDSKLFPLRLGVEDVLLRGMKRLDELQRIREVLHDPGIVLRRTPNVPPPEVLANLTARSLYEAIDGERTIAGLTLHVHGSEYLVSKFLYELHRAGFVETVGVKSIATPHAGTSVEASRTTEPAATQVSPTRKPEPSPAAAAAAPPVEPARAGMDLPPREAAEASAEEPLEIPELFVESSDIEAVDDSPEYHLNRDLDAASKLLSAGEYEAALTILDENYRRHPDSDALRRLIAEAEAAFKDKAYRHYVPADKLPVVVVPLDQLESKGLSPSEYFLLSRMDGSWSVRSIIQISPLREIEALLTLKRMREKGIIELREPATEPG